MHRHMLQQLYVSDDNSDYGAKISLKVNKLSILVVASYLLPKIKEVILYLMRILSDETVVQWVGVIMKTQVCFFLYLKQVSECWTSWWSCIISTPVSLTLQMGEQLCPCLLPLYLSSVTHRATSTCSGSCDWVNSPVFPMPLSCPSILCMSSDHISILKTHMCLVT